MRVGHVGQSGGHTRNEHEPHSAAQASWNEAHGALPLYFNPRVTPRPVPLPQGQAVHVLFFPPSAFVERRWVLLKIPRCDIDGVGEGK